MHHPDQSTMNFNGFRSLLWSLSALLALGIGLVSLRYLAGAGPVPELIGNNAFKLPWLVIHAGSAAAALIIAPVQLLPGLRRRAPRLHRYLGRVYVVGCLLGSVSGLVLAFGSAAGPIATFGFGSLALAWFLTTTLAWRSAVVRKLADHRAWMIRSFALTNAAVTLRLYLMILPFLPMTFVAGYRAISLLCWVPNLLVAELFLRRRASRSVPSAALGAT